MTYTGEVTSFSAAVYVLRVESDALRLRASQSVGECQGTRSYHKISQPMKSVGIRSAQLIILTSSLVQCQHQHKSGPFYVQNFLFSRIVGGDGAEAATTRASRRSKRVTRGQPATP